MIYEILMVPLIVVSYDIDGLRPTYHDCAKHDGNDCDDDNL